jgi:hypothetical protein
MVPAGAAKLLHLQPVLVLLLVLGRRIVAVFAIPALQRNDVAHRFQLSAVSPQLSPVSFQPEGFADG